jgi:hypothetical protein
MRRKSERKGDSGGFGDLFVLSRVFASRVSARIFDENRSVDGISPYDYIDLSLFSIEWTQILNVKRIKLL